MGDVKGFLKFTRQSVPYRPVCERIKDYKEVLVLCPEDHHQKQASRCMDCGTPFCHWGCPVGNYIPEWNDLMSEGQWQKAAGLLCATNNFPEITGRVCPAPCEYACVLGINYEAVTIRDNELAVIEYAFKNGFIKPNPPKRRTGKSVAVIGSGPVGLACADCLNKAGHRVIVFEKDDSPGGIMRYGIPDFKLDKRILDRRLNILKKEGIVFKTSVEVDTGAGLGKLKKEFDAAVLACGSRKPRDLNIPGRDLKGIHFAMDYLVQSNKRVSAKKIPEREVIDACGKRVVVIGGGDTGSDCVGTARRQAALSVVQTEILAQPPLCRTADEPWPCYPKVFRTSTSHEEGCERRWSVLTKRFVGENGWVKGLSCVDACSSGSAEFQIEADLVILALGFIPSGIKTDSDFMTSQKGIFCCGDMRRSQSLIVWAIFEGRQAAVHIDRYLKT